MTLKSLSSRITFSVIGIVLLTVLAITYFAKEKTEEFFYQSVEENALNLLEANRDSIKIAYEGIQFHKTSMLARRKEELKNNTLIAEFFLKAAYKKWLDKAFYEQTAKQCALEALKDLRYADGKGYFWINDIARPLPRMIMHPTMPELEGKILDDPKFNCAWGKDINLFSASVDICLNQGAGYIEYLWPKSGEYRPKISYVKLFEPWGWVIGSGVYIDDIEYDVQKRIDAVIAELNQVLARQKIGENGYFFVFDEDNQMLVHPNLSRNEGNTLVDPETGEKLLDKFKNSLKNGRPVEYLWDKPGQEGEFRFRKKAFVSYFQPLGWYIVTSYYEADLEKSVSDLTRLIIVFSLSALLLAIFISWLLASNIVRPLKALSRAANKTGSDGLPFETLPVSGPNETVELGRTINHMIEAVRRSRIKLMKSESKFRTVFNQTFQFIGILDTDGRVIDANNTSMEIAGVGKSEIIGKPFWETPWCPSPPEMQNRVKLAIRQAASGELVRFEVFGHRNDGSLIYVDFSLKPVLDDENHVFALIPEGRDITGHKQAENVLRAHRENLRTILNSIGEAVIATDATGAITNMNPVAENITGWPLTEAEGKPVTEIFHVINPQTSEPCDSPMERVLNTDKPATFSGKTKVLMARDGSQSLIADSCTPIYDKDGGLKGAVLVFRDITEEHALQTQLQHSRKLDAIGQLAGGLAHDINNMLGGIMGGVEMLQMQFSDHPEAQESLNLIMSASERASELIAQLLAFARKGKIASSFIDIHGAISNAIALLRHSIDKRVTIHCDLKAEKSIVVGDLSQLQSVFLNMGINAVHAMNDGGELRFNSKTVPLDAHYCENSPFKLEPGEYIQIEVQDTGCGIPEEDLARIFEPFFTTRVQGKGTGLGLAAAYGTIQQHQGAIMVSSKVGHGTLFRMLFPLAEEGEKSFPASSIPAIHGSGRILVVEDESMIRKTTRKMLEDLGYEVFLAENGKEGLDLFSKLYPSLNMVILDMIMPEMNGRDCFNAMKEIHPKARIIISSGFTREADIRDLKERGLCGIIRKPYRIVELSRIVSEVIRGKAFADTLPQGTGGSFPQDASEAGDPI